MNINDFEEINEVLKSCGHQVVLTPTPGPDEELTYVTIVIPPFVVPAVVLNALKKAGYLAPKPGPSVGMVYIPQLRYCGTGGEHGEFWTFEDTTAIP